MGIFLFVLKYIHISLFLKMINGFSWPAKIMASPFKTLFCTVQVHLFWISSLHTWPLKLDQGKLLIMVLMYKWTAMRFQQVLWSCFDKLIIIIHKFRLHFDWLTACLLDWLIDRFMYYFTTNNNHTTNSLIFILSWQAYRYWGTFTYAAQDQWLLHFPYRPSLLPSQNPSIMVIRDIHFLLCTVPELPPLIISSSVPFRHR